MKSVYLTCVAVVCCMSWFCTNNCCADQVADEAAIRKNDEAYVAAYNRHDAKAIAAMWSPEAVYMDPDTGEAAVGREAIEKVFAGTLAELKDAKLEIDVKSIKFVSPNVAIETGTARVVRPKAEPEEVDLYGRECEAGGKMAARSYIGRRAARSAAVQL